MKNKRLDGFGYVTPLTWDGADPYVPCKEINHGACPNFEEANDKQIQLSIERVK